jgi:hypothetical protein
MSDWLSGLAAWAEIAAIAVALWVLLGLLIAVAFGHLVASDEGRPAVPDAGLGELARGEARVSALSGQVVRPESTLGQVQVAAHLPARALQPRGEPGDRGRVVLQSGAARPVLPHR